MGFGVDKNLDTESEHDELVALFNEKQDVIPAEDYDGIKNVIDKKQIKVYKRTKEYLIKL